MSSQQPRSAAAAASGGRQGGQSAREQRLRRRRRKQTRLLAGVVGFWVAMGVAIYVVDWGSGAGEDSPFASGDWESIRHAPLDDRTGAGTAWAGDRLVVWSGYDADTADGAEAALFTDGATWSGSGEWREMAPPPRDLALSVGGFAEWTGSEVIFGPVIPATPSDASATEAPGLLAYDPAGDSWREIAVHLDADRVGSGTADDSEASGGGNGSEDAQLVAHRTPLPGYAAALTDDHQLLLAHDGTGGAGTEGGDDTGGTVTAGDRAGAFLIDIATGEGRLLPYDGGPHEYAAGHGEDTPVRLAVAGSYAVALLESGATAWSLDLTDPAARWERSDAPDDAPPSGDGAAAADGTAEDPEPVDGTAEDPELVDGTAEDPELVNGMAEDGESAEGGARAEDGVGAGAFAEVLGAGGEVLALHGDAPVAYVPGAGEWRVVSDPPRGVAPETGYVWTGEAALSAGLVYHPDADTWARTPELPLHDEDSVLDPHAFWTGDVFAVFGGLRLTGCPEVADCDITDGADTLDGWVYLTRN